MSDKRPREYAAEIIAQPDRAIRRKMLKRVPEDYRDWVRGYVEQYSRRLNVARRYE
jgi:flavorubredoxin